MTERQADRQKQSQGPRESERKRLGGERKGDIPRNRKRPLWVTPPKTGQDKFQDRSEKKIKLFHFIGTFVQNVEKDV